MILQGTYTWYINVVLKLFVLLHTWITGVQFTGVVVHDIRVLYIAFI